MFITKYFINKMLRHAFLIIAHNEPYILHILIKKIKIIGDVYVHIDKKVSRDMYMKLSQIILSEGGKIVEPSIDVRWGDYSQIKCEMMLFKTSYIKHYDYYHLLSGVDLPIKSTTYISNFFEMNKGNEFFHLDMDKNNLLQINRITDKYDLFTKYNQTTLGDFLMYFKIPNLSKIIQSRLNISRCNHDRWKLYKGHNWVSLTDQAVGCLISHENYIRKRFRFTLCPDEIYKPTILMNCGFGDKRYKCTQKNIDASLRFIDWNRGTPYIWTMKEKNELFNSGNLFARKFSTSVDQSIIKFIDQNIF